LQLIIGCNEKIFAQSQQQQQRPVIQVQLPHPPEKMAQRYEVDAKRMGVDMNSEDVLPRSREFKRVDSTYYVGWMFEGIYKYNHAADYLGFKNAIVPLERAMSLTEHDYRKALATRTDDAMKFLPVYKIQIDYTQCALLLMNCYSNTDQPDKVMSLMRRALRWNFQRDWYLDAYNYMAWTVHRNRFYTSEKYPFLKNSIAQNEQLANSYLDSGLVRIDKNRAINAHFFPPGYEKTDKMAVYHYKTILYSYALNIDSSEYYYNLMRNSGIFPHNNYATFRSICGDFRTAESEYKKAILQDAGDKRLKEWAYYSSILDIYKALPKTGIGQMSDMIKAAGSTPGFGWYNIALARCLLYDGQIQESQKYVEKAAGFKELHIGTTLGQSHYDFSVQLLKLVNKQSEWYMKKFEHRNWWYNPWVLADMGQLLSEKYLQQFLIINQFAQNPERDKVIYKLFSTESTVSWDEIWFLIKDFSSNFFLDRFQGEVQADNRKFVHKYFEYFVARLNMKEGKYDEARRLLDAILKDPAFDVQYEELFLARVFQAKAECAEHDKDHSELNEMIYSIYKIYPQLLPFTGLEPNLSLHVSGNIDGDVLDRLKACNINWVENSSVSAPGAYIIFGSTNGRKNIQYYVLDKSGNYIVQRQSFGYKKAEDAGIELAYRLFNIGGKEPAKDDEKKK